MSDAVRSRRRRPFLWRRSVFWKVAGVLVAVQVATGLLAVGLSAYFAYKSSLDLVSNSLQLRLDSVAEEIEQRARFEGDGSFQIGTSLGVDLGRRFLDPVYLLDAAGQVRLRIAPDAASPTSIRTDQAASAQVAVPPGLVDSLQAGVVVVALDTEDNWGFAPFYDPAGLLAGGLLIQPLDRSIRNELAGTIQGYLRASLVVLALSSLLAFLLGALVTWRLVKPLQQMTRRVEGIGAGDFTARIRKTGEDEVGRLGSAINQMAAEVEKSVEALKTTDRLRRELVANIGHDLRTPLTALMGYIEESQRYLAAGAEDNTHQALQTARKQAEYLKRLVQDLFELSLLDSGPLPLQKEPVPLAELLHESARSHRSTFERAGVALHLDLENPLPTVLADGIRLLRVLDNLLSNALRHTPSGGDVWLRARAEPESMVIEVVDTGEGMTAAVLGRVFDRHFRIDAARTRHGEQTGLGLAISKAIARAHAGDLTAESRPGKGSCFRLRLPLGA